MGERVETRRAVLDVPADISLTNPLMYRIVLRSGRYNGEVETGFLMMRGHEVDHLRGVYITLSREEIEEMGGVVSGNVTEVCANVLPEYSRGEIVEV